MGGKKRRGRCLPPESPVALATRAGSGASLSEIAAEARRIYGEEDRPPRCAFEARDLPDPSAGRPVRSSDRRDLALYLSTPARRVAAADDEVADASHDRPGDLETIRSAVFGRKG